MPFSSAGLISCFSLDAGSKKKKKRFRCLREERLGGLRARRRKSLEALKLAETLGLVEVEKALRLEDAEEALRLEEEEAFKCGLSIEWLGCRVFYGDCCRKREQRRRRGGGIYIAGGHENLRQRVVQND